MTFGGLSRKEVDLRLFDQRLQGIFRKSKEFDVSITLKDKSKVGSNF